MSTTPTFNAQLLGQTEKACNALLGGLLAGPGLTEPQWVTLRLADMSDGAVAHDELIGRVAGALKVGDATARALVSELAAAQLLDIPDEEGAPVTLTDAGHALHAQIRRGTAQITQRLWGDLPAQDLATAGRVLSTVLARANAELGGD
jgi:hypothetical protein